MLRGSSWDSFSAEQSDSSFSNGSSSSSESYLPIGGSLSGGGFIQGRGFIPAGGFVPIEKSFSTRRSWPGGSFVPVKGSSSRRRSLSSRSNFFSRRNRSRDNLDHDKKEMLPRRNTEGSKTGLNIRDTLKRWVTSPIEPKKSPPPRPPFITDGVLSQPDITEDSKGSPRSLDKPTSLVEHDYSRSRSRSHENIRRSKSKSHKSRSKSRQRSGKRVSAEMPDVPAKWTNEPGDTRNAVRKREIGPSRPIVLLPDRQKNPYAHLPRNNQVRTPNPSDDLVAHTGKRAVSIPIVIRHENGGSESRDRHRRTQAERGEADGQNLQKAQQEHQQRENDRKELATVATAKKETPSRSIAAKEKVTPMWAHLRRNNIDSQAEKDREGRERKAREKQEAEAKAEAKAKAQRENADSVLKEQRARIRKQQPARQIQSPPMSLAASTQRQKPLPAQLNAANLESQNGGFVPGAQASTLNRPLGDMTRTILEGMASPEDIDTWEKEERKKNERERKARK